MAIKVIHIIAGLGVGGAELMLQRLIQSSHPAEYEYKVISLTNLGQVGERLESFGIRVVALRMRGGLDLLPTFLSLRRQITEFEPDIVQTWMYHADFLGGLAARSVGVRRVVWGIRTTEIKAGGSLLTRLIRKMCALLSPYIPSRIVCVADAARKVHERVGYASEKMLVIPNGFDIDKLMAAPDQVKAVRQAAGIADNETVIGSVGRFNAVKNQRDFILAAALLVKKHNNLRFLMVGRGLDDTNVDLHKWIEETGRPECFILLGERSDIPSCLAAMDIFCLHSRTEGFPNALGEAMALARPCVVTDVGDAALLVGGAGIVVPKENPLALAEGLEKLLSLSFLERSKLGRLARLRIINDFTMKHASSKFERLYHDLIAEA
ncbi:glycosyltransferase family 4 protein [Stutzerimonas stutzeri]|uniref:glycosyltransferase family 4 protein n=1 Tax=Stutzerimonas stutzeri TaxID=316 RepID=UPI0020C642A3|nr:glycosyltransferase [Stutzerimonas stutzeri]